MNSTFDVYLAFVDLFLSLNASLELFVALKWKVWKGAPRFVSVQVPIPMDPSPSDTPTATCGYNTPINI